MFDHEWMRTESSVNIRWLLSITSKSSWPTAYLFHPFHCHSDQFHTGSDWFHTHVTSASSSQLRGHVGLFCDPVDCVACQGSSVHGISQARILEWIAISFSRGSFWPRGWIRVSCTEGRFFTTKLPGKPSYKFCKPVSKDLFYLG